MRSAWVVPILPLVAAALMMFFGKRLPKKGVEIGLLATTVSLVWSVGIFLNYAGKIGGPIVERSWHWFPFGNSFVMEIGTRVTGVTSIMFLLVCFVSLMVQIYSTSYMHDDRRYTWYFVVINVFTASMLNLVVANNLIQMLIGWELVGICSYLLIGHWWEEAPNSGAAIKAFITTKIGDWPFMVGIFVLFASTHTFNIGQITTLAEHHQIPTITMLAAALLLFGGAVGKSAQFPLHVWLPDAMAGPTPVSALIHAATMVTAGVFMIARLFPVFTGAGGAALDVVAIIACITMLGAALLAMVQDDVKKVLAYSTISQLAYMFAALGVGAGNAAIFHLFTHGFFKALLFLGAGSLIHSVHSNNMSEMGGLKKVMPITYATFGIGTLALAGIPPFAGFWSKDEILTEAFRNPAHLNHIIHWVVYGAGIVTAFLTAFYMARAVFLVFEGNYRGHGHPHESPKAITYPLVALAFFSCIVGFIGFPSWAHGFAAWTAVGGETHVASANFALIGVSVVIALAGIGLGRKLYVPAPAVDPLEKLGWFHKLLVNKFYLDDLYWKAIIKPVRDSVSKALYWLNQNVLDGAVNGAAASAKAIGNVTYKVIDQKVIDGAVNGVGQGARKTAQVRKVLQSGDVQKYAAVLFGGVAILALLFALVFSKIGG
ncbi:MAG: NADH-quinone oxidoreductase subunit L [Actinomycetota bacterium]